MAEAVSWEGVVLFAVAVYVVWRLRSIIIKASR